MTDIATMATRNGNSRDYVPGEKVLFTIRGGKKRRIINVAVLPSLH